MRWWVFAIAWCACMALDTGLMPAFAAGRHVPQLWPVLLAFVAMHGSRDAAFGAAVTIGLWLDATHPSLGLGADAPRAVHVFGPNVLACAAGAWAVLELRGVLYRRNLLTVALCAAVCGTLASLAFIAIAGIRAAYADPFPLWGPGTGAAAVGNDILTALLSAVLGLLPAWALQASIPAWDFATLGQRFGSPLRSVRG